MVTPMTAPRPEGGRGRHQGSSLPRPRSGGASNSGRQPVRPRQRDKARATEAGPAPDRRSGPRHWQGSPRDRPAATGRPRRARPARRRRIEGPDRDIRTAATSRWIIGRPSRLCDPTEPGLNSIHGLFARGTAASAARPIGKAKRVIVDPGAAEGQAGPGLAGRMAPERARAFGKGGVDPGGDVKAVVAVVGRVGDRVGQPAPDRARVGLPVRRAAKPAG